MVNSQAVQQAEAQLQNQLLQGCSLIHKGHFVEDICTSFLALSPHIWLLQKHIQMNKIASTFAFHLEPFLFCGYTPFSLAF